MSLGPLVLVSRPRFVPFKPDYLRSQRRVTIADSNKI